MKWIECDQNIRLHIKNEYFDFWFCKKQINTFDLMRFVGYFWNIFDVVFLLNFKYVLDDILTDTWLLTWLEVAGVLSKWPNNFICYIYIYIYAHALQTSLNMKIFHSICKYTEELKIIRIFTLFLFSFLLYNRLTMVTGK